MVSAELLEHYNLMFILFPVVIVYSPSPWTNPVPTVPIHRNARLSVRTRDGTLQIREEKLCCIGHGHAEGQSIVTVPGPVSAVAGILGLVTEGSSRSGSFTVRDDQLQDC